MVGAIVAAAVSYGITHSLDTTVHPIAASLASNQVSPDFTVEEALGLEIIFTALLLAVILSVTHGKVQGRG